MISIKEIKIIEKIIGYSFSNKKLLKNCFTHSSISKKKITERNLVANEYERLEFLGDRVLGISIAYLIYKQFPNYNEGKMSLKLSYLVQRNFLFKIAKEFELYKYIKISKDKNINLENNKSILADTLEAIIGAIFLDGGFQKATNLIGKIWKKYIIDENLKIHDSKTTLQELSQKKSKKLPIYKLLKKDGPAHSPIFMVSVSSLGIKDIIGKGTSKRDAERKAADKFLKFYNDMNEK